MALETKSKKIKKLRLEAEKNAFETKKVKLKNPKIVPKKEAK